MATESTADTGPFDLGSTPIHIGPGSRTIPIADFGFDVASFEAYIAAHCRPGEPGRLIMVETTPSDWPSWECHGEGDEIVIVLEGRAEFIQEIGGEERRMPVRPGVTLINPKGIWHTADVQESLTAIYITPCPGTEHRERSS
ncbi:MAG: cupin [Deltaproteobacteria bacterium]|jgi:mannose-6-phosphate isomerase-like protein (cupin superfamily)|nr:cupin [Deltaproteobacteria bacterium]